MKSYFTKYLPVEGKIQEGDMTIGVRGHIAPAITPDDYNNSYGPYWIGRKLVKLFLCSRDLQVGDKFFDERFLYEEFEVESVYHLQRLNDGKRFKTIGEISPAAVWVKEGDEFDEDEIKLPEDLGYPFLAQRKYCRFKCPTCKTFH